MAKSTWGSRETLILEHVYEREEAGEDTRTTRGIADLAPDVAERSIVRLIDAGYLDGYHERTGADAIALFNVRGLTPTGLRAIGAWPTDRAAGEEFLSSLQDLIDATHDEAERTRLEKVKSAAADVGKASLTTLVVGTVKSLGGLA